MFPEENNSRCVSRRKRHRFQACFVLENQLSVQLCQAYLQGFVTVEADLTTLSVITE